MMKMSQNRIEPWTIRMENIDFFFSGTDSNNRLSSLSFALKELEKLEEGNLQNTQAYCTYIWSVLDLLSRLYTGQLDNQQATKRLKKFLESFFPHERKHLKNLILFRNACSHSVTLFASDARGGREVRFELSEGIEFVNQLSAGRIAINAKELKKRLLRSLDRYQEELKKDVQLQSRFERVFKKMGYIAL